MLAEFLLQGMCIAILRLWMQQLVGFNDVNHHFQCCKKHHFSCLMKLHFSWVKHGESTISWRPWSLAPGAAAACTLCGQGLEVRCTYGTRMLGDEHKGFDR